FADGFSVPALVPLADHFAFLAVQFLSTATIEATDPRAEIASYSVWQSQRIETKVNLTPPFDASGPLHLGYSAGDIASRRNHQLSGDDDWKGGFEVNTIAFGCVAGADAVDEVEGNVGAGIDFYVGRIITFLRSRAFLRSRRLTAGCDRQA